MSLLSSGRARVAFVLAGVLALSPRVARADDEAAQLFEQGRALMLEGRFDEACPRLAESQARDPRLGTLLNLAACHEKQGKIGSAWVEYQKVLTAAKAEGQTARAALAEARIAALDPVVPWLTIVTPEDEPEIQVRLDGGALAREAWGKDMPVDPGAHEVTASRGGAEPSFSERVELGRGERRRVRVRFELPPTAPATSTPERIVVEPKSPETAPSMGKRSRWVFEPGLFLGVVSIDSTHPVLDQRVSISSTTSNNDVRDCGTSSCDVSVDRTTTVAAGVNVFAGYAITPSVTLGLRGLVGPNLTRVGGSVFAAGPSVSMAASDSVRFGVWLAGGDASATPYANVRAPASYALATPGPYKARTGLNGGFGVGFEASWALTRIGGGALVATATPLFVSASNGSFFALPIGVAYRFE